jgi:hypothetical protein
MLVVLLMNVQDDFMRELSAVERAISYFIVNDDAGRSASPGESQVTKRYIFIFC